MTPSVDILAFSTHPDDAELGCGGALILAADKGQSVAIADLTEGERSSRGTPGQRQEEKEKAAALLGVGQRLSVGLPDTKIGTDPAHEEPVIALIRQIRPRIVLAPYWQDRHPDHVAASHLIRRAIFYAGVANISHDRPHRPEQLIYYMHHYPFPPSFVVDVSAVWPRRMSALAAYQSQFHTAVATATPNEPETALSRPNFMRFIEARAIWFGAMIGVTYGEPFFTTGPLSLPELPGLEVPGTAAGTLPAYRMF